MPHRPCGMVLEYEPMKRPLPHSYWQYLSHKQNVLFYVPFRSFISEADHVNEKSDSAKNEKRILLQRRSDEDNRIYETYGFSNGSKDNEVYETPYSDDQYEIPYHEHPHDEYSKPKNKVK